MSLSVASDTFRIARRYSATLIETGTHIGLGLLGATYAGFERMITCELFEAILEQAKKNMGSQFGKISYYHGDSADCLPMMLREAGQIPCAILLDAHATAGTEPSRCPLTRELAVLKNTSRNDHLVMVDDFDLAGTPHLGGLGLSDIIERLREINPGYTFHELGGVRPKMLLMAAPPGFIP